MLITYEPLGRQKSVSTNVAKSVFVYDPATLRLDTETISYNLDTVAGYEFSRVLDRSNDIRGRTTGYELRDNTMIDAKANYDYEPLTGRLATVDDGGLSQYIYGDNSFTYTYVENSSSNLIDNVSGGMVRVYNTWEPNRDILKKKENLSRTLSLDYSTFVYTTNAIGQREKVVASGENPPHAQNTAFERTWGYDSRGQLTQENDTQNDVYDRGFAYDAIGNRTKSIAGNTTVTAPEAVSYTPNDLNQYSAITDPASALMTPLYDDDGNTKTSSIRPTGMPGVNLQTAIYDWDAENRLVKITRPNLTVIASYQYDAFGRRIAKKGGDNDESIWVYDGWNPIALYGSPTDLYENYLWGLDLSGSLQGAGGVGGLLAISYSDYNVHYPTYDGNGNVSEYIEPYPDPDFYFPYDFVAAHYEYDAFGNVTHSEGWSASDFPFRFSTKQQDYESGLLYYTYRYYDPLTGRWPSRDPIGERGGSNLYGFVTNDPIFSIDYLGLLQESPIRCCTPDVIADGKKELEKLYDAAVEAFKKRGIEPLGVGSRSCKNIASAVGLALSPIPKCWTCKNEQWAGRFLGDHQWITCVSTPLDDSKGEEIAFDYWGGYGSSVDPNTLRNQYFSRENPDQDLRLTGKNCNSKLGEPLNHDPFAEINKIPPTPPPLTPAIYPNLLNLPTQ